jgi:hypothetical protein
MVAALSLAVELNHRAWTSLLASKLFCNHLAPNEQRVAVNAACRLASCALFCRWLLL